MQRTHTYMADSIENGKGSSGFMVAFILLNTHIACACIYVCVRAAVHVFMASFIREEVYDVPNKAFQPTLHLENLGKTLQ